MLGGAELAARRMDGEGTGVTAPTAGKPPFVDLIAGARPNFMKIAPIIAALRRAASDAGSVGYRLVHTGQHYDQAMSGAFFEQLNLPQPDVNLEVGSGSHAAQTAAIMTRYEALIAQSPPAMCVVVGDVNSTLACAITARKAMVPVAHVEGGLRSGDWSMPEEVNRVATDAISNWFFTTSRHAGDNLNRSGVDPARVFFVGNTMIDTLLANLERLRPPDFWAHAELDRRPYFVVTLHRPQNVDDPKRLRALLEAVDVSSRDASVVFPVHPRTAKAMRSITDLPTRYHVVAPQPYLEFIYLVRNARAVVTDSGGLTEETTVLGVPCITLRASTERPETVEVGTNQLAGSDPVAIRSLLLAALSGRWKRGGVPELWDGLAGERIARLLAKLVQD